MKKAIILILAAAAIAGGVLLYMRGNGEQEDESVRVRMATVKRGAIIASVEATGALRYERSVDLNFELPGIVAEILVEQGETVQKGQVLARLDDFAILTAVAQAELGVRAAELALERLKQPPTELDKARAQAQLDSAYGAYQSTQEQVTEEDIAIQEAQYAQAWENYMQADRALRDAQGRVKPGYRPPIEGAQADAAMMQVEMARLALENVKKGPDSGAVWAASAGILQAEAAIEQLEAGPSAFEVQRAELDIEQAKSRLAQAQAALEKTVLRAPFDGVVTQVNLKEDAPAPMGGMFPAAVLTDLGAFHALATVDEMDIPLVEEGQRVILRFDSFPGEEVGGEIVEVAPVPTDNAGVTGYDVKVAIGETDLHLRGGMTVAATIVTQELEDVLTVPNFFIKLERDGASERAFVNVVEDDGALRSVEVELGVRGEDDTQIISGLEEGQRIGVALDQNLFEVFNVE